MGTSVECCGKTGCCQLPKTTVNTSDGEIAVITKMGQQHLQDKVDNAARIEIDGVGKVVKYEHPMADRAEESYKEITKPKKKKSLWARFCGWINKLTMTSGKTDPHIKRIK